MSEGWIIAWVLAGFLGALLACDDPDKRDAIIATLAMVCVWPLFLVAAISNYANANRESAATGDKT